MWAARLADSGRAIAAIMDHSRSDWTIAELDRAILGSTVLTIGTTLLIGAFGVTRITRRLHQTATVVRRVSTGDVDARVNDPPEARWRSRDSVLRPGHNGERPPAQTRNGIALHGELAHELRTCLTGLNAAAELLPSGRPAELVHERVQTIRSLTEGP